ncbi:MAG: hypothetical protein HKM06_04105 [Spirochaetales bacterium]|nr:hypothetical protein [Spirochaetales bacterium]
MKKFFFIGLVLFAAAALEAQTSFIETNDGLKKAQEIELNVLGLSYGSYSVRYEVSLGSDGLFALGLRGTVNYQPNFWGSGISYTGLQGLADVRIYPMEHRQGPYFLFASGYWYALYSGTISGSTTTTTTTYNSVPYMGGFGWKWLVNDFDFDAGFMLGKQVYLDTSSTSVVDLNTFPFNFAGDLYLLLGYRF